MSTSIIPSTASPLEPDRDLRARWLADITAFTQDFLDGLDSAPGNGVNEPATSRQAAAFDLPIAEQPLAGGMPAILEHLRTGVAAAFNTGSPRYFAYIPSAGLYAAALANFFSTLVNRYTGNTACAPLLVRFEQDVITWLIEQFGFPPGAWGLLTTGGSLANFSAAVTARDAMLGETKPLARAAAYTSSQAHHSVAKGLRLAGLARHQTKAIAVDSKLRLRVDELAAQIARDRDRGELPFLVVAAAGTTNTGTIDPLPELADLCAAENLWLHVDGAYGGAFVLCEEGRKRLAGIERADSITFDPHKAMFLPYGTGCLLVRRGDLLRAAHHDVVGDYMRDLAQPPMSGSGHTAAQPITTGMRPPQADVCEYGPELSRDYRGLRLWLPLMLHGAAAFRTALSQQLLFAEQLYAQLKEWTQAGVPLELFTQPALSVVAFRLARQKGETLAAYNERNRSFAAFANAGGRIHLSTTLLPTTDGGALTLRVCILNYRTRAEHINACLQALREALVRLGINVPPA